MGDNINIDWGLQKPNAFVDGFKNAQDMQDIMQSRQARNAVMANPNDATALAKYAMFDPQGAQAVQGQLDVQRAARARAAVANSYGSYQPVNSFAPTVPVAPPQGQPPVMGAPAPPQAATPAVAPMAAPAPAMPAAAPAGPPMGAQPAQQSGPMQNPLHPVAVAVGQAATQGQMTPQQAFAAVAQEDPAQAQQLVATFSNMDVAQRARVADSAESLGSAAQSLLNVPQAQRAAMLAQMAPQLAQHGIGPQQLQQAMQSGLTDNFLHGVVGQAMGTTGSVNQANTVVNQNQAQQRIGIEQGGLTETIRHDKAAEVRGEAVPFGTPVINPTTGQVIYDGMNSGGGGGGDTFSRMISAESGGHQTGANGQPVTSSKGAIGIAQVMPTTAPEAARLAGVAWDPDKYKNDAQYNSQIGRAYFGHLTDVFGGDQTKAVAAYNGGVGRVQTAVAKYGDGWLQHMPAETQGYVAKVNSGGGSGGGAGAFEGQAKAIANGDASPMTGRAAASGVGAQIMRRVYEINPEFDAKNYNPAVASLKSFTSGGDSKTVQALNNVTNHIAALRALATAQGNGNIPAFNSAANWWSQQTGQPAPTNFNAAKQIIAGEIVKAIAGAGGGEGDRQTAAQTLSGAQSPVQINGALDTIQGLVGSQVHTLQNKYEQGTGRKDFGRLLSDTVRKGFNIGGSNPAPQQQAATTQTGPLASGFKVTRVN